MGCKRLSPAGSLYCGFCSRSFGARYCQNKHANAPAVRCCTTCASPMLSESTNFLSLKWIGLALSGGTAVLAWKWLIAHLALALALIGAVAAWILAVLLNTTPCRVVQGAHLLVLWLVALWASGRVLRLLPGGGGLAGDAIRTISSWSIRLGVRTLSLLLRLAVAGLRVAVWPAARKGSVRKEPEP